MKILILSFLAISITSFAKDAKEIMILVDKRDTGKTFIASYSMKLINKTQIKERELLWWRRNESPKTYNLIKIREPKNLKGTGLLIHSDKTSENQTWLFLSQAAKKEPRKISSSNKDSKFLGSEFYYVDFEENGVEEFSHNYLKEEQIKDWMCDVIESTPKDKSYTYSKIISFVDQKTHVVVKSELFRENKLEKIFNVINMKNVDGIWTIYESLMNNKLNGKQTSMTLNKVKYNQDFPKTYFSLESLIREI